MNALLPPAASGRRAGEVRILEISFLPLLKRVFPERVAFVDTRFRWHNPRTYEARSEGRLQRLFTLGRAVSRSLHLSLRQDYDVVVSRCLGPANSLGRPWWAHLARLGLGWGLETLVRLAARGKRVKLVLLDQQDEMQIHHRDRRLFRVADLYFKRELAENLWHSLESQLPRGANIGSVRHLDSGPALRAKLRPFSLGIDWTDALPPVPAREKRYDVFYSGQPAEIPLRLKLPAALAELTRRGWKVFAPTQRLTPEEFAEALRQSRLCLSPGGAGWDCYRHYEIARAYSVPVFSHRPLTVIAPFRPDREGFYFDPQDDLVAALEAWLRLPAEQLDVMAVAAHELVRRHYTNEALARYVMREIEFLLSPSIAR